MGRLPVQVLIVEDDLALAHFLSKGLKLDGHDVTVAEDGERALEFMEGRRRPEVMILDLGLPRKDGMEVLAEVRDRFDSTSVLVLTARCEIEDKVRCLEAGADDIVLKPFSFHELRARLHAISRRRRRSRDAVMRFRELEMDRAERRVTQAGVEVTLTATEFLLLESLMRRRGERVCSRNELLHEVWRMPRAARIGEAETHGAGMKPVNTNIVEVYINYLRRKLGKDPGGMCAVDGGLSVIRTVRGEGYVLGAAGVREMRATGETENSRVLVPMTALKGCAAHG